MIRVIFLAVFLVFLFYFLKRRSNSKIYNKLIFLTIILTALFLISTSGKMIIPQILQILKFGLPFITKFIGI